MADCDHVPRLVLLGFFDVERQHLVPVWSVLPDHGGALPPHRGPLRRAVPTLALGVLGAPDGCGQVKNLLDDGFAVITPDAAFMGFSFYDTNLPPWYADRRGGLRTSSIDARTHAVTVRCVPARGFGIACTVQGHHDQPWAVAHRP